VVLKTALPYVCSVCGELFTSKAEKADPRHHCEGDYLGKVGVGEPSPDHPDFTAPPEVLGGDIDLELPDETEPTSIPTVNIEDITPSVKKSKKKKTKVPIPDTPPAKASDARVAVLNRAVLAMFAGPLDRETVLVLLAELWGGTVDVEVQEAVKVEVPGFVYVLGISAISAMLIYKIWAQETRLSAMEKKAGSPKPLEASQSW